MVTIFASSFFLAVFWRIVTNTLIDWENNQSIDVYNGKETFYGYADYDFVSWEDDEDHSSASLHTSDAE